MPDSALAQATAQTVQILPDAKSGANGARLFEGSETIWTGRMPTLYPWATRRREAQLRAYYRNELNTLIQGAFMGLIKKVISSPWEISGPKSGTAYFQDMLRQAQFGRGWGDFLSMVLLDYLRQDIGGFIEIEGPGDPTGPLTGRATGLAGLDALHCYPTGDPEFPVVYRDRKGAAHLMHETRVKQLVDMPENDDNVPGPIGLCALSRSIAVVAREFLINRYVEEYLDDQPPPGIIASRNIAKKDIEAAAAQYQASRLTDAGSDIWGRTVWVYGMAPDFPVEINPITFSKPPEGFDYKTYKVDIDVNELALAIGVDVQELWQLTGSTLGSGTQSVTLSQKSRGKTFGTLLKSLERVINDILPPAYEFEFKWEDSQEDQERAQTAQAWMNVINQAAGFLTVDEARRALANLVEPIKDAITDENGQVVRYDDADPKDESAPEPVEPMPAQADDATQTGSQPAPANEASATDAKEFAETRGEFVSLVMDSINAAQEGSVNRRRFGILMRAHLRRLGLQSFRDGLADGGTDPEDMDDRDRAALQVWLQNQSGYVSNFADRVFGKGLSEAQIRMHADMWGNKSLRDAFQLGQASAAWNKPFQWMIGKTEAHCADCLRLNGQIHRMRDWKARGWLPGTDVLECKGFNCDCRLNYTPKQKSRGRF